MSATPPPASSAPSLEGLQHKDNAPPSPEEGVTSENVLSRGAGGHHAPRQDAGAAPLPPRSLFTIRHAAGAAAALALAGAGLLFVMIVAFALPTSGQALSGLAGGPFSWLWLPSQGHFGILPMLTGTLLLAGFALLLGWPLALGLCVFVLAAETGRAGRLARFVYGLLRFMTAVPTVVYGFAAVFLLTPIMRDSLGGTGLSWFTAGLVLALLIVPTMALVLEAGLAPRLAALCPESLALGLTRQDLLLHVALPSARSHLLTSLMLGFGRAVGDTLIALMLAGNAPQLPGGFGESLRTLTAHMALVTSNEVGGAAYSSLFTAGLLLLLLNAMVSLAVRALRTADRNTVSPAAGNPRWRWPTGLVRAGAALSAGTLLAAVGLLLGFLLWKGLPTLDLHLFFGDTPPLQALLSHRPVWEGLWPACVGTLCLVGLTLALALLPGIGCGLFLAEYASPRQQRWAGSVVDVLAGTPSIVMGLFGFVLILLLRRTFWPTANTSLLLAAGCLALLVLPVLVASTREALLAVPEDLRITAAALGFTQDQTVRQVLLPAAGRGIASGVMLALGRAAEDTAVILLTGVVANAGLPAGLGAKFEALPFAIYYTAAQYQSPEELQRGFGAALTLLTLGGGLLLAARLLESAAARRWTGNPGVLS